MKNSEDLSTHESEYPVSSTELTEEIKNKLIDILNSLKDILANDLEFADELIKKCLLVPYGVSYTGVSNLIWDKYPDLREYKNGQRLLDLAYTLSGIIGISDPGICAIVYSAELEPYSREENVIRHKLQDNLQKFISDNWERGNFTQEIEILGMTNQLDNWDIE